jgi:hypothetical protein
MQFHGLFVSSDVFVKNVGGPNILLAGAIAIIYDGYEGSPPLPLQHPDLPEV